MASQEVARDMLSCDLEVKISLNQSSHILALKKSLIVRLIQPQPRRKDRSKSHPAVGVEV
jgi:hypothetical protein